MVKTRARTTFVLLLALGSTALVGGCQLIAGIRDAVPATPDGGPGDGGSGGASTCADGIKDGKETGKDCGGPCSPCPDGEGCDVGPDCASKVCTGGSCLAAACDDKVKNGDETDADCGGSCPKCGADKGCKGGADCKSGQCAGGLCVSECMDTVKGGAETDVDCGGGAASGCGGCADGKGCKTGGDCLSGVCAVDACVTYHVWSDVIGYSGVLDLGGIAVDKTGGIAVTGSLNGAIGFGGSNFQSGGKKDVVVAKFDASGAHVWSKIAGDSEYQRATGVAVDGNENVFITGNAGGAINFGGIPLNNPGQYIAKFDKSGNLMWSNGYGAFDIMLDSSIAVDGAGNALIAGPTSGGLDFGGGPIAGGFFVAKMSASGAYLWGKGLATSGAISLGGIATDATGSLLLAGSFTNTVDFGCGTLTSAGSEDAFVAKLNSLGDCMWSKHFGDASYQVASSIAIDTSGDIALTGTLQGSIDFGGGALTSAGGNDVFVAKLDSTGNHIWSERFGDGGDQSGASVAVDPLGGLVATGTFTGALDLGGGSLAGAGGTDVWVAKFDTSGGHVWSRRFGGTEAESGVGVVALGATNAIALGRFGSAIDLGAGQQNSMSQESIFLVELRTP